MSEYDTISVSFSGAARVRTRQELLIDAAERLCGTVGEIPHSSVLRQAACAPLRVSSAVTLEMATALVHQVTTRRAAALAGRSQVALLQAAAGEDLRAAGALVSRSAQALAAGDQEGAAKLAVAADGALARALAATASRLAVDERLMTTTALCNALGSLGYRFDLSAGPDATALWAVRENQVLAALVHDGGTIELDNAGIAPGGCEQTVAELAAALRHEGADLKLIRKVHHGDDRGGSLINRAAMFHVSGRRHAESLLAQLHASQPSDAPLAPKRARPLEVRR